MPAFVLRPFKPKTEQKYYHKMISFLNKLEASLQLNKTGSPEDTLREISKLAKGLF